MTLLRVATYNVHGHKGADGRIVTDRTFEVVRRLHADCVALQEFVNAPAPTGDTKPLAAPPQQGEDLEGRGARR